jgi:integrase
MPKIAPEKSALEVARLKAPGLVPVGTVPGLCLQVTTSGARSWILRVKIGSKRRDMGLGAYPAVTLAQAREKARHARELIDQGQDPILERERKQSKLRAEQASVITFEAAAHTFMDAKSPEWSNPKHAAQWAATLATYAYPVIGPLHVADVKQTHVLQILQPIWVTKTETASRLRGRIENILDWAKARGYRKDENPEKTTKTIHHPAVPINEAAAFYMALSQRHGMGARALEFTLLTAARSGEVRGAKWAEFDMGTGLWIVPAERMKARKEHRVPLSTPAIGILSALPRLEGSEFVFPAPRAGALSDMALTAVMRRMGLKYVPHGLRSTFSDWAAERTSYPRDLAKMALAHTVGDKVEAAYRRGDMLQKRRAMMDDWAGFLGTPQATGEKVATTTRRPV